MEETKSEESDQIMPNIIQNSTNIENQESLTLNPPPRQFGFEDPQLSGQQPISSDIPADDIQSPNLELDPSLNDPLRDTEEENEEVVYAIRTNIETIVEYSDLLLKIIQEDFFEEALARINHLKQIPNLVKESLDRESETGGWSLSFLKKFGLPKKEAMQMVLDIGSRGAGERAMISKNQNQNQENQNQNLEIDAQTRKANTKQTLGQFNNMVTGKEDLDEPSKKQPTGTSDKLKTQENAGPDRVQTTIHQDLSNHEGVDLNTAMVQDIKSDFPNNLTNLNIPNKPKRSPTSISSRKSTTTISNMDNFATINEDLDSKTQPHIKTESSNLSNTILPQSLHIWEYPSKPYLALPKEVFLRLTEKILSSYADSNIQQNLFDIQKIFHRSIFDAFNESLSEYVFRLRVCSVIPAEIDLLRKVRFDGDDLMFALNKAKYLLTEKASEMVGFLLNKEDSGLGMSCYFFWGGGGMKPNVISMYGYRRYK